MTGHCTHPPGTPCALAATPSLASDFRAGMEQLETYVDTSHESLELWRCRSCGQHWLWWWYETWDLVSGNDPVTASLTPVSGPEEARIMAAPPGADAPSFSPRGGLVRRSGKDGDHPWRWVEPA